MLLLLVGSSEPEIILTRRSEHLSRHPGQISCPGGVREEGDADLRATALRECHEEIGLPPERVEVLGQLDDVWTPSGFLLTPFVGWTDPPVELSVCSEVAEILSIPLGELLDPEVFEMEEHWLGEQKLLVGAFRLRQAHVWGATARLVQRLLEVGLEWKPPR